MKQIQEKTTVINNPSKRMLEFVRGLQKSKEETQKTLDKKAKFFFPKVNP